MEYQLTQEAKELERRRLNKSLPWLSIALLPLVFILFVPTIELIIMLLFMPLFFGSIAYFGIRSVTNSRLSICISIDQDSIYVHMDGRPDFSIKLNEIKNIIEIPNEGLQVSSIKSSQVILIPIGIEGYQILKGLLSSWSIPKEPSKSKFTLILVGVYGTLAIVLAAIFLKSKFLWMIISCIIVIFFLYAFIQKVISSKGIARWAHIIVSIVLAIIAYVLSKIVH